MPLTDDDKNEMSVYVEQFALKFAVEILRGTAQKGKFDLTPIIGEIWYTLLSAQFGGHHIFYVCSEAIERATGIVAQVQKEYKEAEDENKDRNVSFGGSGDTPTG